MGKKNKRRHTKRSPEEEAGIRAAYLGDPIALWRDGEYEALDALYANEEGGNTKAGSAPSSQTRSEYDLDDLPF